MFAPLAGVGVAALAVSGGADSLALLHLAAHWSRRAAVPARLIVLTVDHGLRPGSADEARFVYRTAADYRLACQILVWTGAKPATGIEEAARDARYALLAEACAAAGATCLLTAHHRDDQAETLLMRLARGSGVRGLAAMRPATDLRPGLALLRPLLGEPKARLLATARAAGLHACEDESNRDPRFLRTRLRALMPLLAAEGLDSARLAGSAEKMRRTAEAIEVYALRLREACLRQEGDSAKLDRDRYRPEPSAVRLRTLAHILALVAKKDGPLREERLMALDAALCRDGDFRRTLGGVIVSGVGQSVHFRPESRRQTVRDTPASPAVTAAAKASRA